MSIRATNKINININKVMETLAKFGYVAKGFVYGVIGILFKDDQS